MEQPGLHKNFIFNEKIDSKYLFDLYADDFVYIEEVFATTLAHFDEDFESLKLAYAAGELMDLKKAAHKLKPTFGYVGLTAVQQEMQRFEDLCQKVATTQELAGNYNQIVTTLADSKSILAAEYQKLKAFNANPL